MSKTNVKVKMVGEDGNAFACLGRCKDALRNAGKMELWNEFEAEAKSGDYNHLLATIMDWFDVDLFEDEDEDEYDFDCEGDED